MEQKGSLTITAPAVQHVLQVFDTAGNTIVDIQSDGKLFWNGRQVATDADFIMAVRVIMERIFPESQ